MCNIIKAQIKSYLTLVKICRDGFHCDEHVGRSGSSAVTSPWWSLSLCSPQETLCWLVYEQVEVPVVFLQQVALEIKGRQRGQWLASRFDIFPPLLGFCFGFGLIFRFGLGFAGGAPVRRGAGRNGLTKRDTVRNSMMTPF